MWSNCKPLYVVDGNEKNTAVVKTEGFSKKFIPLGIQKKNNLEVVFAFPCSLQHYS